MKVLALISFVATIDGVKYRVKAGDELELPKGADWLQAGFVEKVTPAAVNKRGGKKAVKDDGS